MGLRTMDDGTTDLTDTEHGQARARAFGAQRPAPRAAWSWVPCLADLTVYVKEQDPDRSRVAAAGDHGATGSKDPKTEVI